MNIAKLDEYNFQTEMRKHNTMRRLFSTALLCNISLKEVRESFDFVERMRKFIRVREQYYDRKGDAVLELGCGHGLIGHILVELNQTQYVHQVDLRETRSHKKLDRRLHHKGRLFFREEDMYKIWDELVALPVDAIIGCHLCGSLTDTAIDLAIQKGCNIMVSPCCYGKIKCKTDPVKTITMLFGRQTIDVYRVIKLMQAGYHVTIRKMPVSITPMNKIIIGTK